MDHLEYLTIGRGIEEYRSRNKGRFIARIRGCVVGYI